MLGSLEGGGDGFNDGSDDGFNDGNDDGNDDAVVEGILLGTMVGSLFLFFDSFLSFSFVDFVVEALDGERLESPNVEHS